MDALPRTQRIGPYSVDLLIGRGGMGEVYRAYDDRLQRWVAIKRLTGRRGQDPNARRRLRREARTLARLEHPAIVKVYDFVEEGADDWIVMEWVAGPSLRALADEGPLTIDRVLGLARQVTSGLGAAHTMGIVHRDLKTENVLLTAGNGSDGVGEELGESNPGSERAKIVDFGLASMLLPEDGQSLSQPGEVMGTPRSMSPEQAAGGEVDSRADLFSLGVLIYELLAGHSPFKGRSVAETLQRLRRHHPPPLHRFRRRVPPDLDTLIRRLLHKDPGCRPPSAGAVADELERLARDVAAQGALAARPPRGLHSIYGRLRRWTPPPLPEEPYPVLLPYRHPDLLAGRDAELCQLRRLLRMPIPLLGLCAPSGTGKSSLLNAGLVPSLRQQGVPTAITRHAREPHLAERLIADLLEEDPSWSGDDIGGFTGRLSTAARLADQPPVLVVDQLEDIFDDVAMPEAPPDPTARRGRAMLGTLIAATAVPWPGHDAPPCRWLLAYRQEYHGKVLHWLQDILEEARQEGVEGLDALPVDFSSADRFQSVPLKPLATPPPGSQALDYATAVFQEVIERPLHLLDDDGKPVYGKRFAPGHGRRLARAFGMARLTRPTAPLAPELQVVLAHLLSRSAADGVLEVTDDLAQLIDDALEEHLRRALEETFPVASPGAAQGRSRALLALRELATATGCKDEGASVESLARTLGPGGEEVLAKLARPLSRLVVLHQSHDGWRYTLAHDALARVVVRVVEEEGRLGRLLIDDRLLRLRQLVTLRTALYSGSAQGSPYRDPAATRLRRRQIRWIGRHRETLICDDERRRWWLACQRQWRQDRRRDIVGWVAVLFVLALVTWGAFDWTRRQAQHRTQLDQITYAEPAVALEALQAVRRRGLIEEAELIERLRDRSVAMDVLERGVASIAVEDLGAVVLETVELVIPWVDETPHDEVLVANTVAALDFAVHHDPSIAGPARELRRRVLAPLRRMRPPPPTADGDEWIAVPAGRFTPRRGAISGRREPSWDGVEDEISVSAFRMLRHEVTYEEYRRLWPDHGGIPAHPVAFVSWYGAYTYAAWLGGRLPTDAEWEYAAQAGCPHPHCAADGSEVGVDAVAWTRRNALHPTAGLSPRAVMSLEPNPWGFYDMLGNLWEWTADGSADASIGRHDPWAPAASMEGSRLYRGGSFFFEPAVAEIGSQSRFVATYESADMGFRVVLPRAARAPEP